MPIFVEKLQAPCLDVMRVGYSETGRTCRAGVCYRSIDANSKKETGKKKKKDKHAVVAVLTFIVKISNMNI